MKEIVDEIDSRIKSPLFGYFLFALVAINWEALFYLFAHEGSASDRIDYFHERTNVFNLFIYPFLLAASYAVLYPWLHYLFMLFGIKPTELKNSLQAQSEHKLLIKKTELEKTRSEMLKNVETELIERAKRDAELEKIGDEEIRKQLEVEIEQLRKHRDEIRTSIDGQESKEKIDLSNEQLEIIKLITSAGGKMMEKEIVGKSSFDRVKTEYYLEDLVDKGYLKGDYNPQYDAHFYNLTTISKKMMVEQGVAK